MLVQVREFMGTCGNVFLHFLVAGRIYFLWFVIYSAAGWLYESTICSQIKYHKFINRGYLRGPWIPMEREQCLITGSSAGLEMCRQSLW